jgi:hypothetical protein
VKDQRQWVVRLVSYLHFKDIPSILRAGQSHLLDEGLGRLVWP